MPSSNPTFVERNYTPAEIEYCRRQPDPAASFAARWAAKEAVFKSLGVSSKGAGAAMKDIEVVCDASGAPQVTLHGDAKAAAESKNIGKVHVSLSHTDVSRLLVVIIRAHNAAVGRHRFCPSHRLVIDRPALPMLSGPVELLQCTISSRIPR